MTLNIQNSIQLQELLTDVRMLTNKLKSQNYPQRLNSLNQLKKIIQSGYEPNWINQIFHISIKQIIKCYYAKQQKIRQISTQLTIQSISRVSSLTQFLPYLLQCLKDRTNCLDIEGIQHLPQKLRPKPGQKPMMIKIIQPCQQIRMLYVNLIKRIILVLASQQRNVQQVSRHLDDFVNIIRALIMDPAPQIQRQSCQLLTIFCKQYSSILLHFSQVMGRAILLPLISKKSKTRISSLHTLTAILNCGLWKYNAFIFQNLIGFRDPNSVPIKDFFQPSNNINYLSTFAIQTNVKVRRVFMQQLKVWICDLADKYDHHGKLVPYLLSGLFDEDQQVQNIALNAIIQIGKQTQQQKQKQFRQSRQYAVDAQWTKQGQLSNLPLQYPLNQRPSLGSRFFIRGHIRKFLPACYHQVRDSKYQNRIRASNLLLYSVIFTQNYLTQFLDVMIPQIIPSILVNKNDPKQCQKVSQKIKRIFHYIGRYCPATAYIHIINSCLAGDLISQSDFVKSSLQAFAYIIKGSLQAVPSSGLKSKMNDIQKIFDIISQRDLATQIYNNNYKQGRNVAQFLINGIIQKANGTQIAQIMQNNIVTLLTLYCSTFYQETFGGNQFINDNMKQFVQFMDKLINIYPQTKQKLQQKISQLFIDSPSVIDSSWKLLISMYTYYINKKQQNQIPLLIIDCLCQCVQLNKSQDMLKFVFKWILYLIQNNKKQILISSSYKLIGKCLQILSNFNPDKAVPVYQQNLKQTVQNPIPQQNYTKLFLSASNCISSYFLNYIKLQPKQFAFILHQYLQCLNKILRVPICTSNAIRTIWAFLQKQNIDEQYCKHFSVQNKNKQQIQNKQNQQVIYIMPLIIDYLVSRIQKPLQQPLSTFVFNSFQKCMKCLPNMQSVTSTAPYIYPRLPDLIDKLIKYTLNQKDIQIKQSFNKLMVTIAKKVAVWVKYQLNRANNQKRYQRVKLIQNIIYQANI